MFKFLKKIKDFIYEDIWRIRLKTLPRNKSTFLRCFKVFILAVKGYINDKCELWASALTFYSLLSLVPVCAMLFGIAKGFGYDEKLKILLYERFAGQEEVLNRIVAFAESFLENAKGGVIAGFGVILLFWTVIQIFGNIESSFNSIWGIKKSRSISRKITDYLSLTLICPVLIIISSSATVFVSAQLKSIGGMLAYQELLGPVIVYTVRLLPIIVIWVLFTFIYSFMPNTKVRFYSALTAGIIAGSTYQFLQEFYVFVQIALSSYNAIYGSFSALPLFLVWLRLSWLIVLFGAEISFAVQNVENTEYEPDCLRLSLSYKKLIALRICHYIVKRFCAIKRAPSDMEIVDALDIPIRLVRELLFTLVKGGVLSEVVFPDDTASGYQPALDIDKFSIVRVLDAMDSGELGRLPTREDESFKNIVDTFSRFREELEKSPANVLLKDIA
ncbi:MAG: ribonuclease BN [Lentisphaerae bacterium GWF2_45_14]|nr:MAG: ribonuclease BN [Lentisphaerae bacterium GWF2_45_14]